MGLHGRLVEGAAEIASLKQEKQLLRQSMSRSYKE